MLSTILELTGILLLVAGAGLISPVAGVIVAGLALVLIGVMTENG